MIDPYEMLGIGRNADPAQIKAAFRRLAKKYHPDVGGTHEKFKRILWAYEQLGGYGKPTGREETEAFDYEIDVKIDRRRQVQDLFDDLTDGVLTFFDVDKPEYLNLFLQLTPDEAKRGGKIRLNLPLTRKCRRCYGFGQILFISCKQCGGVGEETYTKASVLEIPAGVSDGWRAKQHIDNLFLTVIFKIEGNDRK
ncbi:MAG: DnaJ domain-containing protein [Candidatus Zixiibacteriota bacterium]